LNFQILAHSLNIFKDCRRPVVEAPFAFFEEETEVDLRDAVVVSQVAPGLAPDVLGAVDMVAIGGEGFE
jgi:hypothetical protein